MTQGLHFTMLMTGADSAVLADTAPSDSDAADSGIIFGEMLGELVQPAKNSPSQGRWRQLPADSNLASGISLMLTDSIATNDAGSGDMADNALLASSILAQLALTQAKSQHTDAEKTAQHADKSESPLPGKPALNDITADNGKPEADRQFSNADATAAPAGTTVIKTDAKVTGAQLAEQAQLQDELPSDTKLSTDKPSIAGAQQPDGTAAMLPDTIQAGSIAGQKASAQPPTAAQPELAGTVANAMPEPAIAGSDAGTDTSTAAQQPDATLLSGSTEKADKPSAGATPVATASDIASGRSDQPQPTAIASVVAADSAQHSAAEPVKPDDKTPSGSKLMAPSADKADSSASDKAGPGNSSSQHQGQRHSGSASLADLLPESNPVAAGNKAPVETATAALNRPEAMFSQSLLAAEQRQQQAVTKTAVKTPAQQLQQSLNLLQQDAAGQLRERVNLMVRQNIQVAEIRLDPAGLGQMQIKIDMQQDQASVQFVVQQQQAKDLVEQQLPRLREMLQQQGIMLGEGSVQQQSQQQERQLAQQGQSGGQPRAGSEELSDDIPGAAVQVSAAISERLVDYYA